MNLEERLDELDARVEQLIHMKWSRESDYLYDLLFDMYKQLPAIVKFNVKEEKWFKEIDEDDDLVEFLDNTGRNGWYFSVQGRIYKNSGSGTGCFAVEYGYAPTTETLEAAINEALDRLQPRLRED